MKDFWFEIWLTIKQQKVRSIMTAFGVFWGILILTILIGCGIGFTNGMELLFSDIPANSIVVFPQKTSLAYNGLEGGRILKLSNSDIDIVQKHFGSKLAEYSVMNIAKRSDGLPHQISFATNAATYSVGGVTPSYIDMVPHKVIRGRYINEIDQQKERKVCVIGDRIQQALFEDQDPIGKKITVDDMLFTVIGVSRSTSDILTLGIDPSEGVLIPLKTEQITYSQFNQMDLASFVFKDEYPAREIQQELVTLLMKEMNINPDDKEALMAVNLSDSLDIITALKAGINILVWIVGLGTLLAGLIGISNIMMVTVTERTQEIGVRRALGARPRTILRQIISESMILTIASGILGLMIGTFSLYFACSYLRESGIDPASIMFYKPHMPYGIAIISLLILVAGGIGAGWVPAKKALNIKAIDALKEQ